MKRSSTGVGITTILLICFLAPSVLAPAQAQTRDRQIVEDTATAGRSTNVREEMTLAGRVALVPSKAVAGIAAEIAAEKIAGSHVILATPSGAIDANFGRFGLEGKWAPSLVTGQQIEVTGVMKVVNGKPVLMVRTLRAGGEVYLIRNEHGFPVSPQARARAAQMGEKGGAQ